MHALVDVVQIDCERRDGYRKRQMALNGKH
jgi:hypothetical protein